MEGVRHWKGLLIALYHGNILIFYQLPQILITFEKILNTDNATPENWVSSPHRVTNFRCIQNNLGRKVHYR
jgi:hypothetical protein